jgi:hypothetical protein
MSAFETIKKHKDTLIMLSLYLFWAYPILFPFTPPIPIGEKATRFYELIESLPNEPNICMIYDTGPGAQPTDQGAAQAFLYHAFSKDAKVVCVAFNQLGPIMYSRLSPNIWKTKEYGVDYCWLPFIAGRETGLAGFMSNIRGTTTVDYFGDSIETLSILENINNAEDFDLVVGFEGDQSMAMGWIRQVYVTYGTTTAFLGGYAALEPYYPEQLQGMLFPLPGAAAEYEGLLNRPGDASKQLAVSFIGGAYYGFLILIVGNTVNILYQYSKRREA